MQSKQNQRTAKYYLTYLLWYTLVFAVTAVGILFWFVHYNKSLVWMQDSLPQYIPNAYRFITWAKEVAANFLSGNFTIPAFDFTVGLGEAVSLHTEPLYWLYLLFDEENIELAFEFVFLVRFYIAGLSMSVFLFYFGNGRMAAVIGSMAYIFSDFGLSGCFRHSQFMMALIMLPICLLAIEEIYRRKRWYLCTIVIALHMWVGYYFAYMNTIAMGIYFLLRFFCNKEERNFKMFWKKGWTIVGSYLLGVLIGNLPLVTTFSQYLNSSRTDSVSYESSMQYLWYGWKWALMVFADFLTAGRTPGRWLRLGFIPLAFLGIVMIFLKKGKKEFKGAFLLGVAFCLIPAAAFVFSGFSSFTNRWVYILGFVMAAGLAFSANDLLKIPGKKQILLVLCALPFLLRFAYEFLNKGKKTKYMVLASAFTMVLALAVIISLNHMKKVPMKVKRLALLMVAVISIWGAGFQEFSYYTGKFLNKFSDAGTTLSLIEDTPLAAATEIEDDSFYRVASTKSPSNVQGISKILGYYGTVNFSNTTARTVQDFYKAFGLTSWEIVRMKGFDGHAFLETLSSVKYFIVQKGNEAKVPYGYEKYKETELNGKTYEIYENTMALPLGYTYDTVISEDDFYEYDAEERAEVMMQAAVVEEDASDAANGLSGETKVQTTGREVEILETSTDYLTFTDHQITSTASKKGETPTLTLKVQIPEDGELSVMLKNLVWPGNVEGTVYFSCDHTERSYYLHGTEHVYFTNQDEYDLYLGYHSAGEDTITITFTKNMDMEYDKLVVFCQPMEEQKTYTDARKEDVLTDVVITDNRIEGTISLDEEKLLVLTVPYGNGWTAYVDGEETEIVRANLMYSGLYLSEGEHTVVLTYHLPGVTMSLCLSAGGIVILIAALVIRRKKRHAA